MPWVVTGVIVPRGGVPRVDGQRRDRFSPLVLDQQRSLYLPNESRTIRYASPTRRMSFKRDAWRSFGIMTVLLILNHPYIILFAQYIANRKKNYALVSFDQVIWMNANWAICESSGIYNICVFQDMSNFYYFTCQFPKNCLLYLCIILIACFIFEWQWNKIFSGSIYNIQINFAADFHTYLLC